MRRASCVNVLLANPNEVCCEFARSRSIEPDAAYVLGLRLLRFNLHTTIITIVLPTGRSSPVLESWVMCASGRAARSNIRIIMCSTSVPLAAFVGGPLCLYTLEELVSRVVPLLAVRAGGPHLLELDGLFWSFSYWSYRVFDLAILAELDI